MKIDSYGVGPTQNHRNEPAPPPAVVHAQRGDRMADVAQRYGVDEGALRQANPQLGDQLLAGQTLNLPSREQQSAQAAAAAVGGRNAGEVLRPGENPALMRERALEGFRAADGIKPGQPVPAKGYTAAALAAFERADASKRLDPELAAKLMEPTPAQGEQIEQALLKVGAGLRDGKIEPNVNGQLKSQLWDLSTAKPDPKATQKTGNFTGSLAQLSRTGQAALSPELMPGTKVVNDAGAGQQLGKSALPELDPKLHALIDGDVYYQTKDGTVNLDSSKHNAGTTGGAAKKTADAAEKPVHKTTQIERQQGWREAGSADDPRKLQFYMLEKNNENLHALLTPRNLDVLGKAIGDEGARRVVVGDRTYSVGELREMGELAMKKAMDSGEHAAFGREWQAKHGEAPKQAQFYMERLNSPEKVMAYVGKQYGEPLRDAVPMRPQSQFATPKQGAATGAVVGGAVSMIRLAADGRLDLAAAGQVAKDTAIGAGTGAASAWAERAIAPRVDRAIGGAVERTVTNAAARSATTSGAQAAERGMLARTIATRAVGSTAVGAVVSGGISAWENRAGLAKGDSKAIGNVAADTVVGAGAVLGGMAAGAAVGSVVPVVGTAIGAVVGGAVVAWGAHASGARDAIANGASKATDWVKSWF